MDAIKQIRDLSTSSDSGKERIFLSLLHEMEGTRLSLTEEEKGVIGHVANPLIGEMGEPQIEFLLGFLNSGALEFGKALQRLWKITKGNRKQTFQDIYDTFREEEDVAEAIANWYYQKTGKSLD